MRSLAYWMIFQMLIGIWLIISPLVMEPKGLMISSNNMVVGAIVFILGLGVALYEHYYREENVCAPPEMHKKAI